MDYELAKSLKELGFRQNRHDKAKYFINENTIAYFEDIKNAFNANDIYKNSRIETPADWNDNFTYIPELIDFIGSPQYDLSTETAAKQWIDNQASKDPIELVKRTENAINENKIQEA